MGIRALEAAMLAEARTVTGKKKLRQKDILEWSTGKVTVEEGEREYLLPELQVNIVILVGN